MDVRCPICGKRFDSLRGLKIHLRYCVRRIPDSAWRKVYHTYREALENFCYVAEVGNALVFDVKSQSYYTDRYGVLRKASCRVIYVVDRSCKELEKFEKGWRIRELEDPYLPSSEEERWAVKYQELCDMVQRGEIPSITIVVEDKTIS